MLPSKFNAVQFVTIDEDQSGQRIDNYLLARLKGVPKSRVYRLLRKGEVRVNKSRVKPEYRLEAGDLLRLPPVRVAEREPKAGPGQGLQKLLQESILFEDKYLIVINKPSGIAVHGGSGINLGLIEAMRLSHPNNSFLELVHRLDRDTSGCLLIAKKRSVLRLLQDQMRHKKTQKLYMALVQGRWSKGLKRVDAPLLKTTLKSGEWIVRVNTEGKPSVTHFTVKDYLHGASLLEAVLETGRTHQIRLHTKISGHPLAGDEKYGDEEFNRWSRQQGLRRMFLHASNISFDHPEGNRMSVSAPLPDDLSDVLGRLAHV